jgi:hypothetical protein
MEPEENTLDDWIEDISATLEEAWERCPYAFAVEAQQAAWMEIIRLAKSGNVFETNARRGREALDEVLSIIKAKTGG